MKKEERELRRWVDFEVYHSILHYFGPAERIIIPIDTWGESTLPFATVNSLITDWQSYSIRTQRAVITGLSVCNARVRELFVRDVGKWLDLDDVVVNVALLLNEMNGRGEDRDAEIEEGLFKNCVFKEYHDVLSYWFAMLAADAREEMGVANMLLNSVTEYLTKERLDPLDYPLVYKVCKSVAEKAKNYNWQVFYKTKRKPPELNGKYTRIALEAGFDFTTIRKFFADYGGFSYDAGSEFRHSLRRSCAIRMHFGVRASSLTF